MAAPNTKRLAMASAVGTALEWYDFTIYNLMAALIFGQIFFPSFDPLVGTLVAFSTYAVGYVSRPLGGFVFGLLGDRLGRRAVLVLTLIIMGVTSALMGLLPSYASLGIFSPLLLVSLRFIQGVALGGEWAGAVLIAMEHGDDSRRGRNASFAQMGPSCGAIMGTGIIALITLMLSDSQFVDWGWRIPFLLSVVIVGIGMFIRLGISETPAFLQAKKNREDTKQPIFTIFSQHLKALVIAGGSRIGTDIFYALTVVFSLTYVTTVLGLPRSTALFATMLGAVGNAIMVPVYGALSDRFGRRVVYGLGALIAMGWVWVFFMLLDTSNPLVICVAVIIGLQVHAVMYGPQAAFAAEQFPVAVRYSGTSLTYTLSGLLGGAFAPLIITSLFDASKTSTWVCVYVVLGLLITFLSIWCSRETVHRENAH